MFLSINVFDLLLQWDSDSDWTVINRQSIINSKGPHYFVQD